MAQMGTPCCSFVCGKSGVAGAVGRTDPNSAIYCRRGPGSRLPAAPTSRSCSGPRLSALKCQASVSPSGASVAESADGALKAGIASFYDASSSLWEDMWGEHMHHGFYPPSGEQQGQGQGQGAEGAQGGWDHRQAQIEMIERSLAWAGLTEDEVGSESGAGSRGSSEGATALRILDVGCGIGGSARYLARKFQGSRVQGITLSPFQTQRGNELCQEQGLDAQVTLQVADAMQAPFPEASFDLLWSMESGEHMPDKPKFVGELARLAAPGGRIIIVTWCHRDLNEAAGEASLQPWEKDLLDRICDAYYLPAWCSAADYVRIATQLGLKDVRKADWSEFVTPFWPAVIASALTLRGLLGLFKSGWTTMRGALAMLYMVQGYSQGVVKFVIITAQK